MRDSQKIERQGIQGFGSRLEKQRERGEREKEREREREREKEEREREKTRDIYSIRWPNKTRE